MCVKRTPEYLSEDIGYIGSKSVTGTGSTRYNRMYAPVVTEACPCVARMGNQ